jgi:hypothetical protein
MKPLASAVVRLVLRDLRHQRHPILRTPPVLTLQRCTR